MSHTLSNLVTSEHLATMRLPKRLSRRQLMLASLGAATLSASPIAYTQGSDAPEKKALRIGYLPLTDSAPIIMASVLGFDKKYGLSFELRKETSWAGLRDKLLSGDLDLAHAMYGLVYGVHMGTFGTKTDMAVLMGLNQNGQGITVSKPLAEAGAINGPGLAKLVKIRQNAGQIKLKFANTFATGTHTMWLNYWLASLGLSPAKSVDQITLPPPNMVSNMLQNQMDGFCVGEPWNEVAIARGVGVSIETSQGIWPDHPEKVLAGTGSFVDRHPNTARAATTAVLEAARWIEASPKNMQDTIATLASKAYLNLDPASISGRLTGQYRNGLGKTWRDANPMRFFRDGAVNYPYVSDGMWFLTQHKRWGLLAQHPNYLAVARSINRVGIYRQAAGALNISVPSSEMRSSTLFDGVVWNGSNPQAYADRV